MGFHLVKDYLSHQPSGRNFAKVYSLDEEGNLTDLDTLYPYSLYPWKSYTEEELTLEIIRDSLLIDEGTAFCIMPNVGKAPFQRTNKKLYEGHYPLTEDQARSWIQFDIDWGYELRKGLHDMPHEIELRNLAQYVLRELGLPPDIGYVAQRSSSAKIKKDELRIRLYVLLDKALNSAELAEAFSAYDENFHPEGRGIDLSMVENNRIHLVHEAIIADERIEVVETKGPDVILQEGPRLSIDGLKTPVKTQRRSRKISDGEKNDSDSVSVAWNVLNKIFEDRFIPWSNQEKLFDAIEEHTRKYPDEWEKGIRRKIIWWMIRYDLSANGNAYESIERIMSNEVIFGPNWDEQRVKDIEEHQKEYLLAKWGCGDIRNAFSKEECKLINSKDMGELTDEEIDSLPIEDTILVLWSACGTGKTKLAKRLFHRIKPETSLSICYSKAAQLKNAEDFNQTYYLDSGRDAIPALLEYGDDYQRDIAKKAEWDDYTRKYHFMSVEKGLASTAQSIRFGRDEYEWVFIDEIEHCLEALHFKPSQEGGIDLASRLSQNMVKLLDICSKAKFVMVADAKASDAVTGWFVEQIQTYSKLKKFLLENEWDWIQSMKLYGLSSEKHCLQKIAELVEEGKSVAVQVDFANGEEGASPTMDKWRKAVCKATGLEDGREVISRVSDDFDDEEEYKARKEGKTTLRTNPNVVIKEMKDNGLKVILCSPWNQVAFSYEGEPFDATVNIYIGNFTHAEDIEQGFRRWRLTEEHYFYISSRKDFYGKNDITQNFDEKRQSKTRSKSQDIVFQGDTNLTNAYWMRRENPKAHFILHLDAKGKTMENLSTNWGISKYQKILSECKKDSETESIRRRRETRKALKSFYMFGDCVLEKVEIADEEELEDSDFNETARFQERHCVALCERFLMDEIAVRDAENADGGKYYELHWRLWNAAIDVLRPYISGKENHLFDWLISSERELSFHYDNTDETNALKQFVQRHKPELRATLKADWLSRMNKKWTESPHLLFEHIARLLFLDYEKIEKDKTLKLADIHKDLAKEYGITYRNRSNHAKIEILARYRERKRNGKTLSRLERKYESAIAPRYIFRKRRFAPIELVESLELHHQNRLYEKVKEEKISHKNSLL